MARTVCCQWKQCWSLLFIPTNSCSMYVFMCFFKKQLKTSNIIESTTNIFIRYILQWRFNFHIKFTETLHTIIIMLTNALWHKVEKKIKLWNAQSKIFTHPWNMWYYNIKIVHKTKGHFIHFSICSRFLIQFSHKHAYGFFLWK